MTPLRTFLLMCLAGRAFGQIILPVTSEADSGPGSLRQALDDAASIPPGEQVIIDLAALQSLSPTQSPYIELTSGLLLVTRPLHLSASPLFPKVIIGRGAAITTRLLFLEGNIDGEVRLSNLDLSGGQTFDASPEGGAIYYVQNPGSALQLTVENCNFIGNRAGGSAGGSPAEAAGGAIFFSGRFNQTPAATLTLDGCLFQNNEAEGTASAKGGAVFAENTAAAIADCKFLANRSLSPAPLFDAAVMLEQTRGAAAVQRCEFLDNGRAPAVGVSALHLRCRIEPGLARQVVVEDCTFTRNGGAAASLAAFSLVGTGSPGETLLAAMENCTFDGNQGLVTSAITLAHADLACRHLTVTRNEHGSSSGGAINSGLTGTLRFSRCVIAGNRRFLNDEQIPSTSPDLSSNPGLVSEGDNFIGSATGLGTTFTAAGDQSGTTAAPLAPRLASLGDYGGPVQTAPPLPESPLVDAVAVGAPVAVAADARGTVRPQGNQQDIGAVELPRLAYTAWDDRIPEAKDRGAELDPDGDGLSNGEEYFFGTDPTASSPNPLRVVSVSPTTLSMECLRSASIRPAFFSVIRAERSDTLLDPWTELTDPVVTPAVPGQIDPLSYRFTIPAASAGSRFVRYRLE